MWLCKYVVLFGVNANATFAERKATLAMLALVDSVFGEAVWLL